jgi:hypothetical protein
VNAPACSQTGCSGWAPAPELSPLRGSGCRNLALPGVYEQASTPFPNLIQLSFLQNLTHTTRIRALEWSFGEEGLREFCHIQVIGTQKW